MIPTPIPILVPVDKGCLYFVPIFGRGFDVDNEAAVLVLVLFGNCWRVLVESVWDDVVLLLDCALLLEADVEAEAEADGPEPAAAAAAPKLAGSICGQFAFSVALHAAFADTLFGDAAMQFA